MATLPPLPTDWEPTRATLHRHARAVAAVPRAFAPPHPRWWHVSLDVRPEGLVAAAVPLPDGHAASARLDLRTHEAVLETSRGERRAFPLGELTAAQLGDALVVAAGELGLEGEVDRERFADDTPPEYDPEAAAAFHHVLQAVRSVFTRIRNGLSGEVGPIQLWPHGFDLAFEWFGTRTEAYEEDGETVEYPSQINVGFYPAGEAYFYSNPWPFEAERLLSSALPRPARWHIEGWEGSILPYDEIRAAPDATDRVVAYARAVHDLAAPTLTV